MRPRQFSLWQLLAVVGAAALLLGSWRLLGLWALPVVAAVVLAAPLMKWRPRWLFVWFLPALWTSVAWLNFSHPGDEYGGFAVGSLAGLWIVILFDMGGEPARMLPPILVTGAATIAIAGFLLDKLRVPFLVWLVIAGNVAAALYLWSMSSFPSLERALSKNGSYAAYALPAINLGLYAATIVTAFGGSLFHGWQWLRMRGRPAHAQ